jgi:hypothetical protein
MLFITMKHDRDTHSIEDAGGRESLECLNDDHVTALHVYDSRAPGSRVRQKCEPLEGMVGLEYGIEVPDEEKLGTMATAFRDQVTGTTESRPVDPTRLEAKGIELGAQDVTDCSDSPEVHGATVDVDDAFEERKAGVVPGIDRFHDGFFRRVGGILLQPGSS